ncbi:MAG: peptidoglycan recognition family protein [Planctomycetota bacterium]
MTRKVGIPLLGIVGVLVVGSGCQPPDTRITQLPPYVGGGPSPISPLRERPQKVAKRQPAGRPVSPESGWVPSRGISSRWKCIVVHHSGSDGSTPAGMRDWHVNGRGWDGLGYHFVIGNGIGYGDGKVFVGERWTAQKHGAHCKTANNHYNNHGIGICLIGDLNGHPATAKQIQSLARLASFLSKKCGIPKSQILTHGGVTNSTECPGRQFSLSPVLRQMSGGSVWASSK